MSFGVLAASAVFSAAFLALLGYFGLADAAVGVGAASFVGAASLAVRFWRAHTRRRQLFLLLASSLIPAAPVAILIIDLSLKTTHRIWVFHGVAAALSSAALSVYLSTLIDWHFVVPRLSGTSCSPALSRPPMPCTDSTAPRWRTLTQVWLLHRASAFTVFRAALAAAFGILVVGLLPHVPTPTGSLIGATAGVLAAYYLNRIVPVFGFATNPAVHVGDTIILAEEFGTGVERRSSYYVVDVSVDGFQLLEIDEDAGDMPVRAEFRRTHDRAISVSDIPRLLRRRRRFRGCDHVCRQANRYCELQYGSPTNSDWRAAT